MPSKTHSAVRAGRFALESDASAFDAPFNYFRTAREQKHQCSAGGKACADLPQRRDEKVEFTYANKADAERERVRSI